MKDGPSSTSGEGWSENEFLLGASESLFQACAEFASCQRLLGTARFLIFFFQTPTTQLTTIIYDFFYLCLYCIFFSSSLFDYWFLYRIHLYIWFAQQVTVAQHMGCFFKMFYCQMFFPVILTSSHRGRWFPISFYIWSAIPDFSILSRHTAFRCSFGLAFWERYISLLYSLPQLHGMEY